jgi:hypothetical protein
MLPFWEHSQFVASTLESLVLQAQRIHAWLYYFIGTLHEFFNPTPCKKYL